MANDDQVPERFIAALREADKGRVFVPTQLDEAILAKARSARAAYIVMGSHGHGAIYDLLVGSTTHGVLMNAPCPVLVVPPEKGRVQRRVKNASGFEGNVRN